MARKSLPHSIMSMLLITCRARHGLCVTVLAAAAALWVGAEAGAALITSKGGNINLSRKQSWIGNKVPKSTDIALWNSTATGATNATLGANLSWLGIQILNPGGNITFNVGNVLTLGSSGIDMSAAAVDFNIHCGIALGAMQTWNVNSLRLLNVTGVVSGTGALTKSGAGTLALTGANTYTGGTTINGGTVSINSASALGAATGALTLNASATLQTTASFSTSRAVTLGGTGGAASGGTFNVAASTFHTRSGVISGSGSLTKTGTGVLTLTGANTYTGRTYVNAGVLNITTEQALGAVPTAGSSLYSVHLANGTTLQSGYNSTGSTRQVELISGTASLGVSSGFTHQRDGLIFGAGGLIKSSAGTQILTHANTYSGGTTISAGTLQVNNATGSGTGTGAVVVNSTGTLSGLPTATGFATPGSIAGTVTVNTGGTLLARSGGTFTFGGLTLNAGATTTFHLAAPTATSIISISGLNSFSLAGASTVHILGLPGLGAGTYRLFDYNGTALLSIGNLTLGSTPGGGYTYSLSNNHTNNSVDLLVSFSDQQWANDANGNWSTPASWTNNTAPNSAGAQANFFGVINSARTVTVDGAFTLGTMTFSNAHSYTVATGGVSGQGLILNNNGVATISVLEGKHTVSAPLTLANDLAVTMQTDTGLTLGGAIAGSGRNVNLAGTGAVTFSGTTANTYTGLTTVEGGTLHLNKTAGVNAIGTGGLLVKTGALANSLASHQIADTADVTVNGTFASGSFIEIIGGLNGEGSVSTAAGGVLTVGSSSNASSTFSGVISGGGTIAKNGTGTFTLSGANTFGGTGQTIAINAGVLSVATNANLGHTANSLTFNGGTLAYGGSFTSSRAISLTGSGTINTDVNAATLSGVISGTGPLTKTGTGTLALTGPNTYSGLTTINGGTVVANSTSSLGTGALTVNAGTFHVVDTFSSTRNIALGSTTSTIQVDPSHTYTLNGTLTGTGALNKTGAGILTLTKANSFSGATVIDEGTLTATGTNGAALASTSSITVNSNGTLLLGASNQVRDNAGINLAGGAIARGNFNEGSTSSAGFGALTLTDSGSRLDFGTGTVGILTFASFTADENVLVINNWTGVANTIGNASTDRLIFQTSLSATDLASFSFTGYGEGAMQYSLGGGYYEVVPVPEPSTYLATALAVLAAGYHQRRRLGELLRRRRRSAQS